jgi:hypothetical protein
MELVKLVYDNTNHFKFNNFCSICPNIGKQQMCTLFQQRFFSEKVHQKWNNGFYGLGRSQHGHTQTKQTNKQLPYYMYIF